MIRKIVHHLVLAIVFAAILDEIIRVTERHAKQMRREISEGLSAAAYAFLPEEDKIAFATIVADAVTENTEGNDDAKSV